jgi:hypothetical protein
VSTQQQAGSGKEESGEATPELCSGQKRDSTKDEGKPREGIPNKLEKSESAPSLDSSRRFTKPHIKPKMKMKELHVGKMKSPMKSPVELCK